jgi:hypothetical protein
MKSKLFIFALVALIARSDAQRNRRNRNNPTLTPVVPIPAPVPPPTSPVLPAPVPAPVLPPPVPAPVVGATQQDIRNLEAAIDQAFGLAAAYGTPCEPCALGDSIGELVRLGFHDAIGQGFSNGCLDFREADHNGLQTTVARLRTVWAPFEGTGISFADTIVIAGARAIFWASAFASQPNNEQFPPEDMGNQVLLLPTRVGRPDAQSCTDSGELLHSDDTWSTLKASFSRKFGMNNRDIVAIMGAHTLGRAEASISGHDGGWTNYQSSFSNLFYVMMVSRDWRRNCDRFPDETPPDCIPKQWLEPRPHMALDIDVELVITPQTQCDHFGAANPISSGPRPTNNFGDNNICPLNTDSIVDFHDFTAPGGTARWWQAFATSWTKMTESGHDNLSTPI